MRVPILNQVTFAGRLVSTAYDHEGAGAAFDVQVPHRQESIRVPCVAAGAIATTLRQKAHAGLIVLVTGALAADHDHQMHVRVSAFQFLE
jgi:imidazole glycerol phosphate synthase subunit HisF